MSNVYVGQSNLRIQLTAVCSTTGALTTLIKAKSPTGATTSWSATVSIASTGTMYHDLTAAAELATEGVWSFWTHVTFADGRVGIGDVVTQSVLGEGEV